MITDEYAIEPAYNFGECVFEQILLLKRGYETHEELIDQASGVVEGPAMGRKDVTVYPGDEKYGIPLGVVKVRTKTGYREATSDNREEIEENIVLLLRGVVKNINDSLSTAPS